MTTYKYRARTADGKAVDGVVEAFGEFEAVEAIRRDYPVVEKITPVRERQGGHISLTEPLWVSDKVLSLTASQFAIMLRAGLPMGRVVELIAGQTGDRLMKRILTACAADVNAGYSLAGSLDKNGKKIPAAFIETVRAGEESGTLEQSFERLRVYYERSNRVRSKVRGALTYPIVVLVLMVVVIAVIMVVLVPTMLSMFETLGTDLPLPTRMLIAVSNFFARGWPFLLAGAAGIAAFFIIYGKTRSGAVRLGRLSLHIPVVGKVGRMNAAGQFANTLSVLLAAGIQAVRALQIVSRVVDNRAVGEALERCIPRLEAGERLGDVLRDVAYLPGMLVEMVSVGESSGSLENTMDVVGAYYDEESETASAHAIGMLEPMITIVLGVVVGFIVIAIYIPMFSMETGVGSM